MCFSATASFTAGAVLLGIGSLTLRSVKHRREIVFAAIPVLFAIQQLIEGVIWLTFQHDAPHLNTVMTHAYSFFSHVLWPVYVPVAVLLIEPLLSRRQALRAFAAGGIGLGVYLLYMLVAFPTISRITGQHIEYVSPHFFAVAVMTLYLLSTTVSPIVSSHPMVKVFGVLLLRCLVYIGLVFFCGAIKCGDLFSLCNSQARPPAPCWKSEHMKTDRGRPSE